MTAIGTASSEAYRADGLRAWKSSGSTLTYYLYDGGEPILELSSSGTVTALNVFAPDGLVARTAGSATTEYVFDQQGNVADRTDASGAVQSVTQYDAWGNEQLISGTVADPFGYNAQSGYYLDRETGLYLCQHRFYDPANGVWLNRDPIGYGGGTNLYGYCGGSPLAHFDTAGEDPTLPQNPRGLPPGWWQSGHGGPKRQDNGFGRYFPPGGSEKGPGLEFHPGAPGAPGHRGEDGWHPVDGGVKQNAHLRPGGPVPENLRGDFPDPDCPPVADGGDSPPVGTEPPVDPEHNPAFTNPSGAVPYGEADSPETGTDYVPGMGLMPGGGPPPGVKATPFSGDPERYGDE